MKMYVLALVALGTLCSLSVYAEYLKNDQGKYLAIKESAFTFVGPEKIASFSINFVDNQKDATNFTIELIEERTGGNLYTVKFGNSRSGIRLLVARNGALLPEEIPSWTMATGTQRPDNKLKMGEIALTMEAPRKFPTGVPFPHVTHPTTKAPGARV